MRYTFECADIDPDCQARFVSDTDVELLDAVADHIEKEHPPSKKKPSRETIKKAIKPKK
ncbi:MAG TPA: DUF1059 domain-containing protein [Myxococcaceae bacterium]|nr:DUF1059 domain-containing protein [Myxococcaceae bacterium]